MIFGKEFFSMSLRVALMCVAYVLVVISTVNKVGLHVNSYIIIVNFLLVII